MSDNCQTYQSTPRIAAMREVVQALNDEGIRKTTFFDHLAATLRETRGQAKPLRWAKAFAHHLSQVGTPVHPAEQLAGSVVGMWPVDEAQSKLAYADFRAQAVAALDKRVASGQSCYRPIGTHFEDRVLNAPERFASLMARDHYHGNIPYGTLQQLIDEMTALYGDRLIPTEIGRELEAQFSYYYGEETHQLVIDFEWHVANHTNLNYKDLVKKGYGAILNEAKKGLSAAHTEAQTAFYQSVILAVQGAIAYIRRYALALGAAAGAEADPARAAELEALSAISDKIATQPPESFHEALQLVWYTQLIGNLAGGSALSFARLDQYLYPFYQNDLAAGALTEARAFELICALYLKVNEPKMRTVQSLTLAGVDVAAGQDAANPLTRLCLRAMALLRLPYPNLAVRFMPGASPAWLYAEVVNTIKAGCGQPLILNDQVWIPNLESTGMALAAARDYYNQGCTEIMIQGKDCNWGAGQTVVFPQYVLATLDKAAQSPQDFAAFDAFMDASAGLLAADIAKMARVGNDTIRYLRDNACEPFASALVENCLEQGLDYFAGGTVTGTPLPISGQGLGTAADSLSMIKTYVYDKKRFTLAELKDMLDTNFAGQDLLLKELNATLPCYGNDEDAVDEMAKRLYDTYCASVRALNDEREFENSRFVMNVFSYNSHVGLGETLAATPNGRLCGQPLSDCVGPSQGRDTAGPTALLNSVLKLEHKDVTGAYALNFKLSPSVVKDAEGTAAFTRLLEVFLAENGPEIQVNYVDADQLRAAAAEPDKHRDLVVRIAGYCEYFVNLDKKLQQEIIERTAQQLAG